MAPSPPPAAQVAHSTAELWNFPESDEDPGDAGEMATPWDFGFS